MLWSAQSPGSKNPFRTTQNHRQNPYSSGSTKTSLAYSQNTISHATSSRSRYPSPAWLSFQGSGYPVAIMPATSASRGAISPPLETLYIGTI